MLRALKLILLTLVLHGCTTGDISADKPVAPQGVAPRVDTSLYTVQERSKIYNWLNSHAREIYKDITGMEKYSRRIYGWVDVTLVDCKGQNVKTRLSDYTCNPLSPVHFDSHVFMSEIFYYKRMKPAGAIGKYAWLAVDLHEFCHSLGYRFGVNEDLRSNPNNFGNRGSRLGELFADTCAGIFVRIGERDNMWGREAMSAGIRTMGFIGCNHIDDCSHANSVERVKAFVNGYYDGVSALRGLVNAR